MKTIAKRSGDVYIPRGVAVPALDKDILWDFQPKKLGMLYDHTICFMQINQTHLMNEIVIVSYKKVIFVRLQ